MSNQDDLESNGQSEDSDASGFENVNQAGPSRGRKRKRGPIPAYHCSYFLKEDHATGLFDVAFNPYMNEEDDPIFATVGSVRATVYKCTRDGFKAIDCYKDPNEDEIFYACTWLYDPDVNSHLLAVGGKRGVIHAVPFCGTGNLATLVGHGEAVNELMTHPTDSCLLLSGSNDHEIRLWNLHTGVCVAVFGGDGGHKSQVLTCDFDLLGERIVSSGMDHCIKVWSILDNHKVDKAVQQSRVFVSSLNSGNFPTVKITEPDFSTLDVHKNYIDCVRWFGDSLISKSCEMFICHWKPGSLRHMDFSKGETNVSLLNRCRLPHSDLWFMKFAIDPKFKSLAAGNRLGKIFVWDLDTFGNPKSFAHKKCTSAVRQLAYSPDGRILIAVCDDGSVWRWMTKRNA